MSEHRIHIAIAESSPIISAGLTHTMSRLPGLPTRVVEINDTDHLINYLESEQPDILIINPFFLSPSYISQLRVKYSDLKIIAVAVMPLDRKTLENFHDSISIADDVETVTDKVKKNCDSRNSSSEPENKESLSNREKEIIINVVKGLTNKEIADKLFISVHTVITHRRNIARKLEIHSATGLTIYAIVNKLVDLAELHL
ncbi:MAG: response regulator transcription factor [Muribaculaceae bacterium]|nr:response regulator transcription factor [Muribaculaceae bacterium]